MIFRGVRAETRGRNREFGRYRSSWRMRPATATRRRSRIGFDILDESHRGQNRRHHSRAVQISASIACANNPTSKNLRRTSTQTEQHSRKQQLWIHISRLHKDPQRNTHNAVSHNRNTPHTHTVAQQSPCWTCNKRYQLIDKPQRADRITDIARLADALCDDKGYGAIEEDEEAYAEERHAEEVRCDLRARGGELEAEHDCAIRARGELSRTIVGALRCRVVFVEGRCRVAAVRSEDA